MKNVLISTLMMLTLASVASAAKIVNVNDEKSYVIADDADVRPKNGHIVNPYRTQSQNGKKGIVRF